MKYIITENQRDKLYILRRINDIDEVIKSSFALIWRIFKCSNTFEQFFYTLYLDVLDQYDFGDDEKNEELKNIVKEYLGSKREEIEKEYNLKCKQK